jgi:hypothetical protein
MVKPNDSPAVKFGEYSSIAAAQDAAVDIKRIFTGRVYIEHTPSLVELTLKSQPAHVNIIEV